jgi:two-component system LytT family response regulator
MKAIVVDDETKARENLIMLLEKINADIEILGEASNITDAKQLIERLDPDVVFLDIEMPGGAGFQLFDILENIAFQVVFITAYEAFAIKAFQVSAIDYLLKPIEINRLEQCLDRLSKTVNQEQQLLALQESLDSKSLQQLSIPTNNGYAVVEVSSILFFKAEEAYTKIFVQQKNIIREYLYAKHLNYFETIFECGNLFFRTHKSWMVNLKCIHSFDKANSLVNILDFVIPVSRRRFKSFEQIFLK